MAEEAWENGSLSSVEEGTRNPGNSHPKPAVSGQGRMSCVCVSDLTQLSKLMDEALDGTLCSHLPTFI